MAWYENPTVAAILGGIVGSILSVIASVYIWRRTQKTKRIDCVIHDITSLFSVSDKIKDQLEVKFSGNDVDAVYLISIEVINTGNEAITNQPVNIRLSDKSKIIDYSMKTFPPVGFGNITEIKKEDNCLDIKIDLLNPEDRVSFEIVSIDNIDDSIDIYLKNANVESRVISSKTGEVTLTDLMSEKNMMTLAMLSAIPFFGGFARSLINVGLAQRIGRIGK
ncbi:MULTISPECIES: hypothetical protein [Colwellia]|uniref:CARDB domain-containing protein n=1 Tax=Colwellia marinimaniae TaxID=1513592 RepID=A0ABQ0N073_9GAMM|nr:MULTISPECIES: hypothetical protein [Colwellia]GAW97959.1 hypothetical protein MTCD1_03614 [Colwellia marinimaniae]